jgi:hypothetical protein
MTTTNTTTKNSYPFLTKNQIKARIETDWVFCCEAIVIVYNRQTSFEQETKSTHSQNKRGFMSSHAVVGSKIAQKLLQGVALDDEEVGKVCAIASRYTKQLADHFRSQAVSENPALAEKAAAFFQNVAA